eukprot:gene21790-150_t
MTKNGKRMRDEKPCANGGRVRMRDLLDEAEVMETLASDGDNVIRRAYKKQTSGSVVFPFAQIFDVRLAFRQVSHQKMLDIRPVFKRLSENFAGKLTLALAECKSQLASKMCIYSSDPFPSDMHTLCIFPQKALDLTERFLLTVKNKIKPTLVDRELVVQTNHGERKFCDRVKLKQLVVQHRTANKGASKTDTCNCLQTTYWPVERDIVADIYRETPEPAPLMSHSVGPGPRIPERSPVAQATEVGKTLQFDVTKIGEDRGKVGVLSLMDLYSRHTWFRVLRTSDPTAEDIVEQMKWLVCTTSLRWEKWHSDNGPEFRNQEMERLVQMLEGKTAHGLPYRPWVQGAVERVHSTIKRWLKTNGPPRATKITQEIMDRCQLKYNTTPHSGHKDKVVPVDVSGKKTKLAPVDVLYQKVFPNKFYYDHWDDAQMKSSLNTLTGGAAPAPASDGRKFDLDTEVWLEISGKKGRRKTRHVTTWSGPLMVMRYRKMDGGNCVDAAGRPSWEYQLRFKGDLKTGFAGFHYFAQGSLRNKEPKGAIIMLPRMAHSMATDEGCEF